MRWVKKSLGILLVMSLMACHSDFDDDREAAAARALTELASEEASGIQSDDLAVDWTPVFKDWEKGCQNSSILSELQEHLIQYEDNPEKMVDSKPLLGKLVLPEPFALDVGEVEVIHKDDLSFFNVPVKHGQYYGLDIDKIQFYRGHGNGVNGSVLVFSQPWDSIKHILEKIQYQPAAELTEATGDYSQVYLDKQYHGQVSLQCDFSH